MIKYLLILLFCFPILCQAEDYYIFIDKIGVVAKGEEAGHNEYGDVVGISPFTPQYNPTRAELSRYKVIVMDLTKEEKANLLEEDKELIDTLPTGEKRYKTIRARKRKIKIDELKDIKQKEKVDDKNKVFDELIVKPVFTNDN